MNDDERPMGELPSHRETTHETRTTRTFDTETLHVVLLVRVVHRAHLLGIMLHRVIYTLGQRIQRRVVPNVVTMRMYQGSWLVCGTERDTHREPLHHVLIDSILQRDVIQGSQRLIVARML